MFLSTDITFVEKYHRVILEVLAAGVLVFGIFWVKDKYTAYEVAAKDKVIAQLDSEYKVLLAQKTAADQKITEVSTAYAQEHAQLIAALNKKPIIIQVPGTPLPQLPSIPAFTSLDDCNKTVKQLQVDNNACTDNINALQEGKKADTALIGNLQNKVLDVDKENTEVKKDLSSETERKKAWRWTAIGGWILAVAKFLI